MSSRLSHEYNVYTELAGSAGVSPVRWYGKEGSYEVIVMDHLGTSLGDLISGGHVDHGEVFQYAPQMVCSHLNKYNLLYSLTHTQLSAVELLHTRHFVHRDIKPANFTVQVDNLQRTVSLIDFGLAQLFRNPATYLHNPGSTGHPVISTLHSPLSLANEGLLNHGVTTWSLLPTLSFIQHVVTCLGPFLPTVITKQSSRRRCRSQQKSCAKACLLPSANSLIMFVPLALTRSRTTNYSIPFSCCQQPRLTTQARHYLRSLPPLPI